MPTKKRAVGAFILCLHGGKIKSDPYPFLHLVLALGLVFLLPDSDIFFEPSTVIVFTGPTPPASALTTVNSDHDRPLSIDLAYCTLIY